MSPPDKIESWGRYPKTNQSITPVFWSSEFSIPRDDACSVLPYGLGRSYGDSCLNDGGRLILTRGMNRFISFDDQSGLLRCEAGTSLAEILDFSIPRGWFLPVTPGTRFVTIGGAVANDVHGKNHHRAGTIGNFVHRFELLRSDGTRRICSAQEHSDLYKATIGGLGLTGVILWVDLYLKPIRNPWIDAEFIRFPNLETFFELAEASDKDYEYTVSWVDCSARGASLGRGIFIRGNHAGVEHDHRVLRPKRTISVPFSAPSFLLNRYSMKLFNTLYYHKQRQERIRRTVGYDSFFYPLDGIFHWNRLYGRRGFFQYQCVVPDRDTLVRIFEQTHKAEVYSFLSVLKKFGDIHSPGLMSFPRKGLTLTMDMPVTDRAKALMAELDKIVRQSRGAVYPAKDARMVPGDFQAFFPQWRGFRKFIDPGFSSNFWRRVTRDLESSI